MNSKRAKRVLLRLGAVIILISISLIGTALYFIDYSLRPSNNVRGRNLERALEEECSKYPYLKTWADSLRTANALCDTFIASERDGAKLHAYYVKSAIPTTKTALLIHGYTDNSMRMMGHAMMYNRDMKMNVMMPDLRYAGKSEGEYIQMGWFDRLDALQWTEVAEKMFGTDSIAAQIVVQGVSMGAATTMMMSGEETSENVRCFIEDCGYTSVWDEFEGELKVRFHLPAFPLLYVTSAVNKLKNGWSFGEASALEQVKKCQKPMLFIHGDKDTFVPTRMVYELYKAKQGDKELWITEGTSHALSLHDYPEEYRKKVKAFINKYMN